MYIDTVGMLKKYIEDLDDNTPLISKSNNFELNGEIIEGADFMKENFRVENKEFFDAFDYETYHKDVYVYDPNGKLCLKIS